MIGDRPVAVVGQTRIRNLCARLELAVLTRASAIDCSLTGVPAIRLPRSCDLRSLFLYRCTVEYLHVPGFVAVAQFTNAIRR